MSEEEFKRQRQGQTGTYEIVITSLFSPDQTREFYFRKMGIDPTRQDQLSIAEEFITRKLVEFSTLFDEIAQATGVPAEKRVPGGDFYILNPNNPIFQILGQASIEEIQAKVHRETTTQIQKELEERKKSFEQKKEGSMKGILIERKRILEDELNQLRAKKEAQERYTGEEITKDEIISAIQTDLSLTDEEKKLLLREREIDEQHGKKRILELLSPPSEQRRIEREIEDLEYQIAQYRELTDLEEEIKVLREEWIDSTRQIKTKDEEGRELLISPAPKDIQETLRQQFETAQETFQDLNDLLKQKKLKQLDLQRLTRILDTKITIKGQEKTIRDWLSEVGKEVGTEDIQAVIATKENEVAEITVLLEYFDESNLLERKIRENLVSGVSLDCGEVVAINPKLNEIFDKNININVLKKLYILFGERFLFPQTPEDYERMRLINIFLEDKLKNLKNLTLKNLDEELKKLRTERLNKIRKKQ